MNKKGGLSLAVVASSLFISALAYTTAAAPKSSALPIESGTKTPIPPEPFVPATKEQNAVAIEAYKKDGAAIAEHLKLKLTTLETAHFLIFTDWDPREFNFLKENVELAYTCVSAQFQLPVTQNIFLGKLPIYMLAKKEDFARFSKEVDDLDSTQLAGYYTGNRRGHGHMAMWKPDVKAAGGDIHIAEKHWGHVLVHEFTHAFIARYRTDGYIPRWLNEGVAEVVSYQQFPRQNIYSFARSMAKGPMFTSMFEAKSIAAFTADDYPIAQTTVETLIAGGPKKFLKYFNDIKDGVDPDEALQNNYKTDRKGLEDAWKKYLKTVDDVSDTSGPRRRKN